MRRRAWIARPSRTAAGYLRRMPRKYHLDPDCGSRELREPAETTEAQARKIACLCGTCRRVYGPYEDRWRHRGVPAGDVNVI